MIRICAWINGFGLAALVGSTLSIIACSSEGRTPGNSTGGTAANTGGTPSTGGASAGTGGASPGTGGASAGTGGASPGTGGASAGTGGASAGGSGGGGGTASVCMTIKPSDGLITDFEAADAQATTPDYDFGKAPSNWVGGTYTYPPANLTSSFTNKDWAISGKVGTYSGFGIWVGANTQYDASNFTGIQFDVSGTVGADAKMVFRVGTGSTIWSGTMPGGSACFIGEAPGTATDINAQYTECALAGSAFEVSSSKKTITVTWDKLVGGKSNNAEVPFDAKKLVKLQWEFTWPPAAPQAAPSGGGGGSAGGATGGASGGGAAGASPTGGAGGAPMMPYDVAIVIDNLRFMGSAGGAGGMSGGANGGGGAGAPNGGAGSSTGGTGGNGTGGT